MAASRVSNDSYTIAVFGPSGSGKSAFILQAAKGVFGSHDPQIDDDLGKVDVDGKLRDFHALEAQWTEDDGVQLVIDNTVRQAKGVLILCACDDSQALESATYMAERVLRVHDDDKFPVVLVATKSDLPIEQQKLSLQEAHEFATKHNVIFLESSAATSRAGVLEAVAALIRTIDATPPPAPLTYKPKKGGACAIS